MPRFVRQNGTPVLDAIERDEPDFFIPVWHQAGFRFLPTLIHSRVADHRFGVVTFPMPRDVTEAYLCVIVGPEVASDAPLQYFTWESATSFLPDGTTADGTMIGEWNDKGHGSLGEGPPFTGNLHEDVRAVLGLLLPIVMRRSAT